MKFSGLPEPFLSKHKSSADGGEREETCFLPAEADSLPKAPQAGRHTAPSPLDEGSPGLEERGDPPSQRLLETETWRSSTELVRLSSARAPLPQSFRHMVTWGTMVMGDGFSSPLCPPEHSLSKPRPGLWQAVGWRKTHGPRVFPRWGGLGCLKQ